MKNSTISLKTQIKNIFFAFLLVIALVIGVNLPLASAVVSYAQDPTPSRYEPTETVSPYEFTSSSGWTAKNNGTTENGLSKAFENSRNSVDLYNINSEKPSLNLDFKPATKYNNDPLILNGVEKSTAIDDYALTLQAKEAPTKVVAEMKDKDGNTRYLKDGYGNFVFEPAEFTWDEVKDLPKDAYEQIEGTEKYKKKIEDGKDEADTTKYKDDGNDGFLYVPKTYTKDEVTDSSLFVQVIGTEQYNKKIPRTEEKDAYYGYETQSTVSLRADCWFVFSFWIWTDRTGATFVISSGDDVKETMVIEDTQREWKKCYFFVEANSDNSTSVKLGIYYGFVDKLTDQSDETVSGGIFLDNLTVRTISETDYRLSQVSGETFPEDSTCEKCSLRYDYNLTSLNPDFEEALELYETMYKDADYSPLFDRESITEQYEYYLIRYTDDTAEKEWAKEKIEEIKNSYANNFSYALVKESEELKEKELDDDDKPKTDENGKEIEIPGFSTFNEDNTILKLKNDSPARPLGLLSAPIPIKQFGYYKLSLYVKTTKADEKAIVKVLSNIKTGNSGDKGVMQIKSQSVSGYSTESKVTNNWVEVSFYIQGSSYYDTKIQFALLADAESTVYFDHIRFETISSATYRGHSSTNSDKFDLAPSSTTYTSSISNGFFDSISTSNADPDKLDMPYEPYGWSALEDNSKNVVAGIVSTNERLYSDQILKDENDNPTSVKEKLGGAPIPTTTLLIEGESIPLPATNVLAIYSPRRADISEDERGELPVEFEGHTYGYKSGQFTLSSNSVYEISFEAFVCGSDTEKADFEGKFFANLIYSEDHVAELKTSFVSGSGSSSWVKYSFLVRTGASSRSFNLELGVEDAFGTIFFQNVNYKQLEEKDNPDEDPENEDDDKITVDQQFAARLKENDTIAKQNENRIRFVDFDGNSSIMFSSEKKEDKDYYESLSHELLEDEDEEIIQGELGVVETTSSVKLSGSLTLTSDQLSNPNVDSKFAMMIYNDKEYHTTIYPKSNSSLSSTSFYRISVWVKTIGVKDGSGLTVTLNNVSAKFENVNSEHGDFATTENNGYTKLSVIVKTGSSSISALRIGFELGTNENKTTGVALISGINIEKLKDEDEYNEIVDAVDENDNRTILKDFTVTSKDSDTDSADNLTLATFFLVFSSILLVAVLVFAIVATYIKRIPKQAKAAEENENPTQKDGFV